LLSFSPGNAIAAPKDIIDPNNPKEAAQERQVVREDRARQKIERDVRNESGSGREHLRRAAGDAAEGLITGLPLGSFAVSNAVLEVAKGCTNCHQTELMAKIRDRLNKLGTTGQAERDRQKVLQRIRDLEARNSSSRPSPSRPSGPSPIDKTL
jgi:hypothetical protein